ncbi:MAG: DNA polymerase III subunit beta [Patescibacteria group bacterium]|nr:DNA polymerase III subunit beta [Patescibacteria group bacterium]
MKISCTQENLTKGLSIVSHMISSRTTLPVLNNILLKVEKGRLSLLATDLEIGISTWIGAKVDAEGAITVPARLLSEYITTNTDKTINLELKGTTLHLSSDHFKANIKGIEASEFPSIPEVKDGPEIEIQATDFKDGIIKTVFACAVDETRPVLAGVYLKIVKNKLKLVATDSYRLAEKTINLISTGEKEVGFIVPGRTLGEIGRLLNESIEKVEIMVGENQVQFKLGPTTLISRLIDGNFPDYEQIIPTNIKTKINIRNKEFQNAIKMASFFARDSANNIKLQLKKPKTFNVIAVSPQMGDNTSELEVEITGDELEIAFNAKFILDCLSVVNSEEVSLEMAGSLSPGIVRPLNDKNYLYIIMPLRTDE